MYICPSLSAPFISAKASIVLWSKKGQTKHLCRFSFWHYRHSKSNQDSRMCRRAAAPFSLPATVAWAVVTLLAVSPVEAWRPWPSLAKPNSSEALIGDSKKYEGSSEFVHLKYHMGPVLTSNITVHVIWYGTWQRPQKAIIRDFIGSISAVGVRRPSVAGWWSIVRKYTDQTGGNISGTVHLGKERNDRFYSHGKSLTRLSVLCPNQND